MAAAHADHTHAQHRGWPARLADNAALHQIPTLNLGLIDLKTSGSYGLIGLIGMYFLNWLVTDFFFYWGHRCMHKVPALWAHHKMHHMD